jgi:hypothetical protein
MVKSDIFPFEQRPMIQALLHGKLSLKQENAEDILTSNVFGLLRYVRPEVGILPFLARSESVLGERPLGALIDRHASESCNAHYDFWPRWDGCEPDILLDIKRDSVRYLVAVEAKYRSSKSSFALEEDELADDSETDGPEARQLPNDQLAKEWSHLAKEAIVKEATPVLVYLTAHIGCPKSEIEESLKYCTGAALCWLSWRELPRLFRGQNDEHLKDIVRLAERLDLSFFEGCSCGTQFVRIGWIFQDNQWRFVVPSLTCVWSFEQ